MNIFASSTCPTLSAAALDDRRLVKMILESAQIICTIAHQRGIPAPYKATHQNHPAVLWADSRRAHFDWLRNHFRALAMEYQHRFGRVHKSYSTLCNGQATSVQWAVLNSFPAPGPEYATEPLCWPSTIGGSPESCREILIQKWQQDCANGRPPKWTNSTPPTWYQDYKELRQAIYTNHKDQIVADLNQDLVEEITRLQTQIKTLQEQLYDRPKPPKGGPQALVACVDKSPGAHPTMTAQTYTRYTLIPDGEVVDIPRSTTESRTLEADIVEVQLSARTLTQSDNPYGRTTITTIHMRLEHAKKLGLVKPTEHTPSRPADIEDSIVEFLSNLGVKFEQ